MKKYVEKLDNISSDINSWGGKAVILQTLLRYSLPIPRGIVLHTYLYEEYQKIRDKNMELNKFKSELNDTLSSYLQECEIGKNIIFRSSANVEGNEELCCSGIFESYALKKGLKYADMSILVWESSHNAEVIKYLSDKISIEKLKMGIIIQSICIGEFSGVMQTCNVIQKKSDIVIEYCPWRIEAVVDGADNTEQVILSKDGELISGVWNGEFSVLKELYNLGKKIESILGYSVEVEFVIYKNTISILQARKLKEY